MKEEVYEFEDGFEVEGCEENESDEIAFNEEAFKEMRQYSDSGAAILQGTLYAFGKLAHGGNPENDIMLRNRFGSALIGGGLLPSGVVRGLEAYELEGDVFLQNAFLMNESYRMFSQETYNHILEEEERAYAGSNAFRLHRNTPIGEELIDQKLNQGYCCLVLQRNFLWDLYPEESPENKFEWAMVYKSEETEGTYIFSQTNAAFVDVMVTVENLKSMLRSHTGGMLIAVKKGTGTGEEPKQEDERLIRDICNDLEEGDKRFSISRLQSEYHLGISRAREIIEKMMATGQIKRGSFGRRGESEELCSYRLISEWEDPEPLFISPDFELFYWIQSRAKCDTVRVRRLLSTLKDLNGLIPLSEGYATTYLMEAVRNSNSTMVRLLLEAGAQADFYDPTYFDPYLYTPLAEAVTWDEASFLLAREQLEIAMSLLTYGADPALKSSPEAGETILENLQHSYEINMDMDLSSAAREDVRRRNFYEAVLLAIKKHKEGKLDNRQRDLLLYMLEDDK